MRKKEFKNLAVLTAVILIALSACGASADSLAQSGGGSGDGPGSDNEALIEIIPDDLSVGEGALGALSDDSQAADSQTANPPAAGDPAADSPESAGLTLGAPEEEEQVSYLTPEEALREEREEALAAESINSRNTLIPTDTENIFYLNGRPVDITKPSVALTYDDGPVGEGDSIMDTMDAYGARCTFFLLGYMIPYFPDEVRRMVAEGHEIGNHTYRHVRLTELSVDEIRYQLDAADESIAEVTGEAPAIIRVPFGSKNDTVLENVHKPVILWNVDSRDYASKNVEATISEVVGKVKDGDIVLLHEIHVSTTEATKTIVPALTEQGFQLVTVSELAAIKGVTLEPGHVYYSF